MLTSSIGGVMRRLDFLSYHLVQASLTAHTRSATAPMSASSSISPISEPNVLHQAMKTIHHAVVSGLGNGNLVSEMPMHDPLMVSPLFLSPYVLTL